MTRILTLLIALGLGTSAFAQDTNTAAPKPDDGTTTAATPAEDTATTGETPPAATGLSMGADGDDSVGKPYVKEEFGDWSLQCIKTDEGEDPCQLYQLLTDENGNSVAEFSMFRLPDGGQAVAGATVVVPLETLLTEDLAMGIDGSKGKRYRFAFCNQVGCIARIGLTKSDIAAFRNGKEANLTIVPFVAPDVKVKLNLSLIGFTKGFEAITVAPQ